MTGAKQVEAFSKTNASRYSDALLLEVDGLRCLQNTLRMIEGLKLCIPQILKATSEELLIEKVDACSPNEEHYQMLGMGLARMHTEKQDLYGYGKNNYIGLNPQNNILCTDWGAFFFEYRLEFQCQLIMEDELRDDFLSVLSRSKTRLINFLNDSCEFPSLVHGDLWSGNVLFSLDRGADVPEQVWLIDPAVYYADREVDIAMTEMFGGFAEGFYQAYERVISLTESYSEKKIVFNLYHYLNHYNLFGGAYLAPCKQAIAYIERNFT